MAKLPVLSAKQVIAALSKAGFAIVSQRGSHVKLKKAGHFRSVIVPNHREISFGTLHSIIKQSGMEKGAFLSLVEKQ